MIHSAVAQDLASEQYDVCVCNQFIYPAADCTITCNEGPKGHHECGWPELVSITGLPQASPISPVLLALYIAV